MSNFSYAEAEVMARRYLCSLDLLPDGVKFEDALGRVIDSLDIIEGACGHITFIPPLAPAGGVYGEERNWLRRK